jgi:hypothetical protein
MLPLSLTTPSIAIDVVIEGSDEPR